jgi:hypothetical protein
MNFRVWGALAVAALVAAPLLAHLLRRRPPEEQPFAGTRLVPEAPAIASRRTALEDRALFALRALAVLALAALGATPMFRCARLSLTRQSGASVALAIVLDDSLSMRVRTPGEDSTRFTKAVAGAKELLGGMQQGDAVAVVLAGDPVRVAIAATTNLDAVRSVLDKAEATDRGTDVDGAVRVASELLSGLEHLDKRVVVLGDLEAVPGARVDVPEGVRLWAPLKDLAGSFDDCAVIRADRSGTRVTVRVACTRSAAEALRQGRASSADTHGSAAGRRIGVFSGSQAVVDAELHLDGATADVGFTLPDTALDKLAQTQLYAALLGGDDLPEDDAAPVVAEGAALRAAVVSDPANDRVPTGGAPLVEQAFRALEAGVTLTPMASVPDQREELEPLSLLLVDDPEGFTPAERRDLGAWVERGGIVFLALGKHAAAAPLGSGFSPLLPALVRWRKNPVKGLVPAKDALFADAADGLDDLGAAGRALLEVEPAGAELVTLARWSDDVPFVVERRLGRGLVVSMMLPLSSQESDIGLRPALFALLDRVVAEARSRSGTGRTVVGASWPLAGSAEAKVTRVGRDDRGEVLPIAETGAGREVTTNRAGVYELVVDGVTSKRVAMVDERELASVPLELPQAASEDKLGGTSTEVDVSPQVALVLLGLLAAELLFRTFGRGSAKVARPTSAE